MTTRSMLRAWLGVPALAGVFGLSLLQAAPGEPVGRPADAPAIRQSSLGAVLCSPTAMGIRQSLPGASRVLCGKLVRKSAPSYPLAAKRAGVSGVVIVQAVVGADGRVVQTSVIRGPNLLRQAALDTVAGWLFEPTLVDGRPVERLAEVDVRFDLGRN